MCWAGATPALRLSYSGAGAHVILHVCLAML
jgi:hypothetical protein